MLESRSTSTSLSTPMATEPSSSPDQQPAERGQAKSFTLKALTLGLILSLFVVVMAWFNDQYLGQSPAIGNFLPALPFGIALFLVLGWNPTLGRWSVLRLSTRELAVVFGLTLMVSWLPTSGFLRYFQRAVVTAQVQADSRPEWRKVDVLGHMPTQLFPLGGAPEVSALGGAIEAERSALAAGTLTADLAIAKVDAAAYAAALDLAALVPPKMWRDEDQELVRANTQRSLERAAGHDPTRWASAGELLKGIPKTLATDNAAAPASWSLARQRLNVEFSQRIGPATKEYERVYTGMTQGLPVGDETLPFSQTPIAAWIPALAFWLPLVLLMTLALVMLQLIVHRQWSHHEQLNYPIAAVATSLIQRQSGSLISDIFRARLFWFGVVPIFAIHLLNYCAVWFPGWVPNITLRWSQWDVVQSVFPSVSQAGGSSALGVGAIFFSVIGLAFFISSEVSFSMGIAGFVVVIFNVMFYAKTGTTTDLPSARSGAYIGYALILLYTGRTYYWAVARKALGLAGGASGDHAEPVWAARLFLLAFAGFTAVLVGAFGIDWFVALAYALTLMVFFLVFTRVVCETGVPFLQAGWQPAQLMTNVLGVSAIGAAPLVMIHYLGVVLSQDPRECFMPFAANALKMGENTGVKRMRLAWVGFAVIAVALVVGVIATLWGMYNFGSTKDAWAQMVVGINVGEATRGVNTLVETGQYASTTAASGLEKLPLIAENVGKAKELSWIAFGMITVVVFAVIRFRWAGFYIHPVLFLVWDTYPATQVWMSFFFGWMAKELVVRFGGGRVYQNLKPLFIGIIVGELAAVVVTLTVGWIYHLTTGLLPKTMGIFAG